MAGVGSIFGVALSGVRGALRKFERAAETLAGPLPSLSDSVSIGGDAPPDVPSALVDLRVQKYAVVANLKTLATAGEVADAALEIGKRK